MSNDGQHPKPRRRWSAAALIVATTMGGLAVGSGLTLLAENPAFETRTTARLIRDLNKTDSPLDHLRQKVWPLLPDFLTERLTHLTPMPAKVVRQFAAVELKRRAPDSVEALPALILSLRDASGSPRGMVLQALGGYGRAARAALADVLPIFDAPSNTVLRSEAARTLVAIAPEDPQVRARLLSILRERPAPITATNIASQRAAEAHDALRCTILRLADKLPHPDEDMVPLLLNELPTANSEMAVEIMGSLQRIGPTRPEVIRAIVHRLQQAVEEERAAQIRTVADSDPGSTTNGPVQREDRYRGTILVRPAPGGKDAEVTAAALRALQKLATADNEAVPLLIETIRDGSPALVTGIVQTLGFIGPVTPEVLPAIVRTLTVEDPRLQSSAVRALGAMGTKARPAVPAIAAYLQSQWQALARQESSKPGEVVQQLLDPRQPGVFLDEPGAPRGRWPRPGFPGAAPVGTPLEMALLETLQVLGRIGPAAHAAVPAISMVLSQAQGDLRYDGALALWQVDRTNPTARTVLLEGLNIPTPQFALRLSRQFRTMGVEELPILVTALDHIDDPVRAAAINALGGMGSRAGPALMVLERIADDPSDSLRQVAWRAVENIHRGTSSQVPVAPASPAPPR